MPYSCGRLPQEIGIPAGGSLTADQWKNLVLVHGPIIVSLRFSDRMLTRAVLSSQVPQLWQHCLPDDPARMLDDRVKRIALEEKRREDKKKAAAAARAATRAAKKAQKDAADLAAGKKPRQSRKGKEKAQPSGSGDQATQPPAEQDMITAVVPGQNPTHAIADVPQIPTNDVLRTAGDDTAQIEDGDEGLEPDPPFSLHPDDPKNFLKLSEALRFISQRRIWETENVQADKLLREYNTELITVSASRSNAY